MRTVEKVKRGRPTEQAAHDQLSDSGLLIPVPKAEPLVARWRARYDISAQKGVPAHITVLSPFAHPSELTERILQELRTMFAEFEPFVFRLTAAARFSNVLYLAPEPADPFIRLTSAVVRLYPQYPPYGGAWEPIPHLTVADCDTPSVCENDTVLDRVERSLLPGLPIVSRAAEVWLMCGNGRWQKQRRFRLGG